MLRVVHPIQYGTIKTYILVTNVEDIAFFNITCVEFS